MNPAVDSNYQFPSASRIASAGANPQSGRRSPPLGGDAPGDISAPARLTALAQSHSQDGVAELVRAV
ncbi:MAG: hypothetical protein U0P48_14650 [Ancrocorticia sp.]